MTPTTSRIITLLFTVALTAGSAVAANTVSWTSAPVPLGTDVFTGGLLAPVLVGNLDGFIVNDLILNTTSDWTAAALLITLTSGSIFQEDTTGVHNGGTLGEPNPALFPFLPSSEYDSRIFDPHGGATIAGAAGDAGGDVQQFDTVEIDISWNSADTDTADVGVFSIGRFTWSNDAQGIANFAMTVAGSDDRLDFFFIIIPEPTSLTLLGLGGLGLLRRRRRVGCVGEV